MIVSRQGILFLFYWRVGHRYAVFNLSDFLPPDQGRALREKRYFFEIYFKNSIDTTSIVLPVSGVQQPVKRLKFQYARTPCVESSFTYKLMSAEVSGFIWTDSFIRMKQSIFHHCTFVLFYALETWLLGDFTTISQHWGQLLLLLCVVRCTLFIHPSWFLFHLIHPVHKAHFILVLDRKICHHFTRRGALHLLICLCDVEELE